MNIILVILVIGEIVNVTHAKFQAKTLNIVESRAL